MQSSLKHFWCHSCKSDLLQPCELITCSFCQSELIEEVEPGYAHPSSFNFQMSQTVRPLALFSFSFFDFMPINQQSTAGVPQSFIDSLETVENCSDTCVVCQEEVKTGRVLPCSHTFHLECIQPWLLQKNTCPKCRAVYLFELNRSSLSKIFESHQIKGLILFTDVLKICTSLRIFPNLLSSKDLRSLITQVCNVPNGEELSAKLSYKELEDFLRCVSENAYPRRRGIKAQHLMFFMHIKNPCFLRYALLIEVGEEPSEIKGFSIEKLDKNVVSTSPYRRKLIEKKIYSLNEVLNNKRPKLALTNATSESSLSFSPHPKPHPASTTKNSSLPTSSFNFHSTLAQFEQRLTEFSTKSSGLFKHKCYLHTIRHIESARDRYVSRLSKLSMAFKIWVLSRS